MPAKIFFSRFKSSKIHLGGRVFVAAFKISFHFRCCPQAKTPITHVSDFCVSIWGFPWFTKLRTLLVQPTEFREGRVWEGTASLSFFLEPEHIAPWHISVSTIQKFLWACVQRVLLKFYYPGMMCLIAVQITESSCLPPPMSSLDVRKTDIQVATLTSSGQIWG